MYKIDHLDLSLHGDAEQCNEVHNQNRPEDRDIEKLPEGTEESDCCSFSCRILEFKLW